jgi:hypothetical protein
MSSEHTPTPWYVAGGKTIRYGVKGAGGDGWIGKANWQNGEANAEFIVRAVNCHDELVAVMKEARDKGYTAPWPDGLRDRINLAIAKAEGRS